MTHLSKIIFFSILYVSLSSKTIKSNAQNLYISHLNINRQLKSHAYGVHLTLTYGSCSGIPGWNRTKENPDLSTPRLISDLKNVN